MLLLNQPVRHLSIGAQARGAHQKVIMHSITPYLLLRTGLNALTGAVFALAAGVLIAARADTLPALPEAAPAPAQAAIATQVLNFDWVDTQRNRTVPVRLYWPAQAQTQTAAGKGQVPLIVFSHGLGGSRAGYSYLGRYWASQGFASLHVQHAGSDRAIWGKSWFNMIGSLHEAASPANALARVQDVSFAITQILSQAEFAGRIDANAIAVAGHSYGANTAMLLAGAQVPHEGIPANLRDERVKAAIFISAPPFYGEGSPKRILASIAIPTLHITGTKDDITIPGYYSGLNDRIDVFEAVGSSNKLLAVFDGGTHSIFTDRVDRAGPELNSLVKAATKELSAAFFKTTLLGQPVDQISTFFAANRSLLTRASGAMLGMKL
jgi:predicted dienelactone hydrolase